MWYWKPDPGPCPVDECPHHTCVAPEPPEVVVLPARDGMSRRGVVVFGDPTPTPTSFTTATYRGGLRIVRSRR